MHRGFLSIDQFWFILSCLHSSVSSDFFFFSAIVNWTLSFQDRLFHYDTQKSILFGLSFHRALWNPKGLVDWGGWFRSPAGTRKLQVACLWSCGVPLMTLFFLWALWCNLEASGKLLESAWQQAATGGRLRLRKLQRPEIKILVGQMES